MRTVIGERGRWLAAVATAGVIAVAAIGVLSRTPTVDWTEPLQFDDVRAQTLEFMEFNRAIRLTAEQERVNHEALSALPAPCCSQYPAETCCCDCNMARAIWGLSEHLIADRGYQAEDVRAKVAEWIHFINPDGFSGDACFNGGCPRPFRADGCGGMDPSEFVVN